MDTVAALTQVFNTNFMAYYRSHTAHANIRGRNFYSDHKLLNKIYDDLQGQIDTIAELLRAKQAMMPNNLNEVVGNSNVMDLPLSGDSRYMLSEVYDSLEILIDDYNNLESVADSESMTAISNYAQERILVLSKFCWMLRSTLDDSYDY